MAGVGVLSATPATLTLNHNPRLGGEIMSLAVEARKLLAAEQAVKTAKGALETAERDRAKIRNRIRPHLTILEPTRAGNIAITITPMTSGQTFRLAEYLREHKLTKTMEPYVGGETPYERWKVERVET